jgi:DNA-binding transcriptional MerR regulator
MSRFGLAEVARLVGLTPQRIRSYARAGLITPLGAQEAPTFAFQDLVLLKNARRLLDQGIAPKKVQSALAQLRQQLDGQGPLSAVGLSAEGGNLIAEQQQRRWDALSGPSLVRLLQLRGGGGDAPAPGIGPKE